MFVGRREIPDRLRFSALQRAENSSIEMDQRRCAGASVSVLFSEPKIPQFSTPANGRSRSRVSVLFSEPKIPQFSERLVFKKLNNVSVLFSEPKIPQYSVSD